MVAERSLAFSVRTTISGVSNAATGTPVGINVLPSVDKFEIAARYFMSTTDPLF